MCVYIYIYIFFFYVRIHTHIYIYIYGRPPPHVPTFFGVFLWPKTVRCVLAVLFRSRNQSNTLQSRTIAQNQKKTKPKKQKKTKPKKKTKKTKKTKQKKNTIISELSHLCIFLRLFWKSIEIMDCKQGR